MVVATRKVFVGPYGISAESLYTLDFRLETLDSPVEGILCEKGKLLTEITGYTQRSLLTLQDTPKGPY